MHIDLPKWILISVRKHFTDILTPLGVVFFMEGQERDTTDKAEWYELRVDGPWGEERSKGNWIYTIEVNMLVAVGMSYDQYRVYRNVGKAVAAFTRKIDIFKYGTEVQDTGDKIVCATQERTFRRPFKISHFGQIQATVKIIQATVESRYYMELDDA